jgi:hypothetical protein
VENPQPGSPIRIADINTDVKRDLSVSSIVLAVLIGLCVLGIAVATGKDAPELLALSCAALAVLVSVAIIRTGHSRFLNSSVASACGITLLVLGAIAAIFIFFVFTCVKMYSEPIHRDQRQHWGP